VTSCSPTPVAEAYRQAESFLMGLVNYEKQPPPMCGDTEGWHLEQFRQLLHRLGDPHLRDGRPAPIIHIAGTKGKGSTTRILSALLTACGWKNVGSFTSPHIAWFRERIAIDGEAISEDEFVRALDTVRRAAPPEKGEGFRTTFETLTAMALEVFRDRGSEAIVLETGMGGRLDSTNVPTSRVAVITTIGYDHQKVLGQTLDRIAWEKAGIIKPGTDMAILGIQVPRRNAIVRKVVQEQAARAGVPLRIYSRRHNPFWEMETVTGGFFFDLRFQKHFIENVLFPVLGQHQFANLRVALEALDAFAELQGRKIDPEGIRKGLGAVTSPGRMELVRSDLPALVDAAHCPLSAKAAIETLEEHFPGRPVILTLGLLEDKKIAAIVSALAKHPDIRLLLAHTPPSPRACLSRRLVKLAQGLFPRIEDAGDIEAALDRALAVQKETPDAVILSTGSFYTIDRATKRLMREKHRRRTDLGPPHL